jgi:lipopolysaccharide exporter
MTTTPTSADRPSPRRAVLGLAGGSVAATVLTLAVQPLLTRLYSAEAFGVADLYGAVLGVLFPIASLRYEDALVLPDDERDAAHLFWLAVLLTLGTCALVALLPFAGAALAGHLPGYAALLPFLVWLAPGLLVLRWSRLLEAYLARARRFGPIAAGNVVRAGVTGGHRLSAGWAGDAGGALVVSQVTGSALAALVQTAALRDAGQMLWRPVYTARLGAMARRYRRFALLTTPASLLAGLATRLPFLGLAAFFSPAVVGLFGRVYLVLAVPLSFVGGAAARVLAVEAAEGRRTGTLAAVAARYHGRLVALGVWPALVLVLAGPDLFAVGFGPAWREAGVFAQMTAPWLFLASTASALSPLFDVTERHRHDLGATVLLFAGTGAALVLAGTLSDAPRTALLALGVAGAGLRALHVALLLRVAGVSAAAALRPYIQTTLRATPTLAPVLPGLFTARPLLTCAGAALGGLAYAALVWRAEGGESGKRRAESADR